MVGLALQRLEAVSSEADLSGPFRSLYARYWPESSGIKIQGEVGKQMLAIKSQIKIDKWDLLEACTNVEVLFALIIHYFSIFQIERSFAEKSLKVDLPMIGLRLAKYRAAVLIWLARFTDTITPLEIEADAELYIMLAKMVPTELQSSILVGVDADRIAAYTADEIQQYREHIS